ncbi:MAG: hypothetical protein AAF225_08225 [Pseudomonadota bacterium]
MPLNAGPSLGNDAVLTIVSQQGSFAWGQGSDVRVLLRFSFLAWLVATLTACASVQLGGGQDQLDLEPVQEREAMADALERLGTNPWEADDAEGGDAFLTVLFGGSGPSTRDAAKTYLRNLDVSEDAKPSAVRRDVDLTLAAAWQMVDAGWVASRSVKPQPSDVRMVEEAITEARHCRLVYAQAMTLMAKDGLDVAREDVIYVKDEFTRAILELGRTADALTDQLKNAQPDGMGERPSLVMTTSY